MQGIKRLDMKARYFMLVIMLWVAVSAAIAPDSAAGDTETAPAVPWVLQGFQAWGQRQLAVDFGQRGLWNYDGSWIQLSYWDPETMTTWGDGRLAVDFGPNGLWSYDGVSWVRLSVSSP